MADSASDQNVEDVLSSVRRLVSQEIPKRSTPKPAGGSGALVLTSKHRIEADHTKRVAALSLEQRIAELEAAVDKTATEFEPDGSEDQAQHRPDRIVYTRPQDTNGADTRSALRLSEIAVLENVASETSDATEEAPVEFRRSVSTILQDREERTSSPGVAEPAATDAEAHVEADAEAEAPMAEDVPTLPRPPAEVRAFSDPDDVVERIEARIERGADTPPPMPIEPTTIEPTTTELSEADRFDRELRAAVLASLEVEEPATTHEPVASVSEAPVVDTEPEAEDVPAKPEAVSTSNSAEAEPRVAAPTTDPSAETSPPSDVAQAAILTARARALRDTASKKPMPATRTPQTEKTAESLVTTLADEDAMRLLVGRLLREELQGELGERITQNVRKLVRREIKRMIDVRELD